MIRAATEVAQGYHLPVSVQFEKEKYSHTKNCSRLPFGVGYYVCLGPTRSESNIGARKGKGCRNHIWVINGINQEKNSSMKHAQLVIQSFDFTQMFDSMSLDSSAGRLHDKEIKGRG